MFTYFLDNPQRMMEGGCSKVFATETTPDEFDGNEIPMSHEFWNANLNYNHPICDMKYGFVKEILRMNNRTCCSNLFIAYDGRGDIISLYILNIKFHARSYRYFIVIRPDR